MHRQLAGLATSFATILAVIVRPVEAYDAPPVEPGFASLFDGKDITRHFVIKGNAASWKAVDGEIHSTPGGDRIVSREKYGDFVLRLEWKVSKNGNSGIFLRVPSQDDAAPWVTGFEAQISNEPRDADHCTGSLYGVKAVDPRPDERDGVWHSYEIASLGRRITVKVDGLQCVDADYEKTPEMQKRPLEGYIGLQDSHSGPGSTIEYRNIRIQRLSPDGTIPGFTLLTRDGNGWHKIKTGHGSGGRWTFAAGASPTEGAWSGEQDPPGSGNGGINVSDTTFGDFEVVLEAKPDWGCDSGVFLRSTPDGKCYQVLVDYYGGGNVGGIYGEGLGGFGSRSYDFRPDRGIKVAEKPGDALPLPFAFTDWSKHWQSSGFNEIRARIAGNPPVIDVWLNGIHLTHFEDRERRIPEKGHLGIQVHGGKGWPEGAMVRYRAIQVREGK